MESEPVIRYVPTLRCYALFRWDGRRLIPLADADGCVMEVPKPKKTRK